MGSAAKRKPKGPNQPREPVDSCPSLSQGRQAIQKSTDGGGRQAGEAIDDTRLLTLKTGGGQEAVVPLFLCHSLL